MMRYSIDKVTFKHPEKYELPCILTWFNKPHIQEYFDHPETGKTIPDLKNYLSGKPHFITHWIAYHDQVPFAYLLTSEVMADENNIYGKWREKEGKTYTLDLLIGEEEFLGKGLSHLMIKKFIHDQFLAATAFLIDPETRNTKAIHVYEKAGFIKAEEFRPGSGQFATGLPHVLMKLNLKFEKFLSQFTTWTAQQNDIQSILLVGSHARGQAKPTSDIDLCILVDHPKKYLSDHTWAEQFGVIQKIQTEYYGKVTSLRIHYKSGLEVEYSFTTPDWADIPVDEGTRKVITDGVKILYDPKNKLDMLLKHINEG